MNNLSNPASPGNNPISTNTPITPPNVPQSGGIASKEKAEVSAMGLEAQSLKEIGREAPLAPEVGAAGVTIHPTSVTIPPPVAQLGVKQVGDTPVAGPVQAVALPLTDDQIAQGLHQGITSSWRWLAQWCVRRLKQLHLVLKNVHGKVLQVKAK